MDREQAQFILESFRPDGADAVDADFADALQLAAQDRQLGEWLADERSMDSDFASALNTVKIPEDLRQHILSVMRGERPSDPEADQEMDTLLIGVLGELQPPAGLREEILASMEIQEQSSEPANVITPDTSQVSWFTGWRKITAVAAALVLGAFFAIQLTSPPSSDGLITSIDVQREAGRILDTSFELDVRGDDPETLNTWLVGHHLPTTANLPSRLKSLKSLGCKEIDLPGGKQAAIICFVEENGNMVHLIMVKNEYIADRNLPTLSEIALKDCYHCPRTKWNILRWQDSENTFILIAKKGSAKKNELFRYF